MNIGPPPFVHYDVACPVILEEGQPTLRPYVVARPRPWPEQVQPIRVPEHLVVLSTAAGMYVHLDPRQVAFKRDELLRTAAIGKWEGWLYDIYDIANLNLDVPNDHSPDEVIHALFPGTPERFYFNPLRARVEAKRIQIADATYASSELFCPLSMSSIASYVRGESLT